MMKKILFTLIFVHCLSGQTEFRSPYLQSPELMFGYVDSCAKFWMKAYDAADGGFYVNINRQGNLSGSSIKNTLNQSRDAYGFTRAFQLTGDTTYRRYARYALDFVYKNSWDKSYGGWYNSINKNGTPSSPNETKTAFYQHYALLGIAAAYEAFRDSTDWSWLMKGYEYNETNLWDTTSSQFGYYDYVAANGSAPTNKSFNATVDAVTTHVLHLYLLTGDQQYKKRLLQLADNMINRLAASATTQAIGFAEKYSTSWGINESETMTIMGHVLKTGWCLARIYQLERDPLLLSTAENLVQSVLEKGYDHQNGGPYKDYNRVTGEMLMWGITDTAKAWWQMEQAVTAGLMLYQLTGKEQYKTMADETLDFFMKYFVDHVYGDVFENANRYGGMIPQWGTTKGGTGKAAYHSVELGYYVYLYGNLLVNKEPATLHYYFSGNNLDRQFVLRPVGMPDGSYTIASVRRNGEPYSNYDSTKLTVNVPATVAGLFAVTFRPATSSTPVVDAGLHPEQFELRQNYPNPFNPTTTIVYSIPSGGQISIIVYDVLGKEVQTIVNSFHPAGTYSVHVDAAHWASGMYVYRLQTGLRSQTKKMVLTK